MVIFMPYYGQHRQLFHSHSRTQPSSSSTSNGQNNITTTTPLNSYQIVSCIFCRFTFSLFSLIIGLFLFYVSIYDAPYKREGAPIMSIILLTVAIVSFIRTFQKLRQYYIIMDTRRQLRQRLNEQQQAYDFTVTLNNNENPERIRNASTDLPSYKELFPSHLDINNSGNDSSLPSYDDYIKRLVIRHATTNLSHSHTLPLSNISSQSRSIWITDRTQTPVYMRDTVTYV